MCVCACEVNLSKLKTLLISCLLFFLFCLLLFFFVTQKKHNTRFQIAETTDDAITSAGDAVSKALKK